MFQRRVVITGIGALTPIGNNVEAFWNNLENGVSGAAKITRFDVSDFRTQFACELKNFKVEDYLDSKDIRMMDPSSHYGIIACDEAIEDSGLSLTSEDLCKIGVMWGTGIGGLQSLSNCIADYLQCEPPKKMHPFFIPKMIANMTSGHISIKYGFKGPVSTSVSACASSNDAVISAIQFISSGHADVIVTGGSEAAINDIGISGFSVIKALSERNNDPQTASRPFDNDRDGFVMGEGAGAMVLELYEHALHRGAKIYAEIAGFGMSADAYHITAPLPNGAGAALAMSNALKFARLTPQDIDYVNAHGTSTGLGDIAEIKALVSVFESSISKINISSTKSMTGHMLGATGVVESIVSVLALNYNVVPPTINHFKTDSKIDSIINLTPNKAQKKEINFVLNNSFGFGGHNTSIILKKLP